MGQLTNADICFWAFWIRIRIQKYEVRIRVWIRLGLRIRIFL